VPRFTNLAYGNYSIENFYSGLFEVTSADFNTHDDLLAQAFFNFVAANTRAVAMGNEQEVRGLKDAAFIDSGEFTANLQTNINSPGNLNLISKCLTPLVAAALFVLAVEVGPSATENAKNGTIVLKNSKTETGDPCTAEVEHHVIKQLQLLGLDDWPEACEKAREVARRTGLKSPSRVLRGP